MTMLRFYLMTSPEFRREIAAAVRAAGHDTIDPPTAYTDGAAESVLPTLLKFDALVYDFNVSKFRHSEAGFWRGRGHPVVYVAGPSKSASSDAAKYAARLGFYPCQNVAHFAAWLRAEPAYLMPPGLDENGEFQEKCAACGGGLRAHWNDREYKCCKCGQYTRAADGFVTRPGRARAGGGGA